MIKFLAYGTTSRRTGYLPYSHEEHTAAYANLDDDVPDEEKQERVREIMELQDGIAAENNRQFEGKTLEVLIDEVDGSRPAYGRTQYDAPEVDNECIIDIRNAIVKPGDFCMAAIEDSTAYELYGNRCKILTS